MIAPRRHRKILASKAVDPISSPPVRRYFVMLERPARDGIVHCWRETISSSQRPTEASPWPRIRRPAWSVEGLGRMGARPRRVVRRGPGGARRRPGPRRRVANEGLRAHAVEVTAQLRRPQTRRRRPARPGHCGYHAQLTYAMVRIHRTRPPRPRPRATDDGGARSDEFPRRSTFYFFTLRCPPRL